MIAQFHSSSGDSLVSADPAGGRPIYIYHDQHRNMVLYSESITELLDDERVVKPLSISNEGVSFLLQSGVIPSPKSVYENIYILGIGDLAKISCLNGRVAISFEKKFPFYNRNRSKSENYMVSYEKILELLSKAVLKQLDKRGADRNYLFHSAGKDSNSIALALHQHGLQTEVTLVSHKSKGKYDESEISRALANKMGFRHAILREMVSLGQNEFDAIEKFFYSSPFPCTDNVSLAYPLYASQMPELTGSNIIDGMGNDVFIGHVPSRNEYRRQAMSKALKHMYAFNSHVRSESYIHQSSMSRSECTGLVGISDYDLHQIFPGGGAIRSQWRRFDSNEDYFDFRARIRGGLIDTEIFMRKVRNFSDAFTCNVTFPWTDEFVVDYFSKMPEIHVFDRSKLKNKLVLRYMLKDLLGLDSDKQGKMAYKYDSKSFLISNRDTVISEICGCNLWDRWGVLKLVERLWKKIQRKDKYSDFSARIIFRLYIMSAWVNRNRYSNKHV